MNDSTSVTKGIVLHSHARYYDLVMGILALRHGGDTLYERLVDIARLAPDERVLDVGCGTGSLAVVAKARVGGGGMVHGIDASKEMVERASRKTQRRRVQVDFQIATVETLPFPERSFDVVFSALMLHHLPRPVRRKCVEEMARVLTPGGRVLVADFQTPARRRAGWLPRLHRHGFARVEEVRELLAATGFRVLESGEVGVRDLHFTIAAWEGNR